MEEWKRELKEQVLRKIELVKEDITELKEQTKPISPDNAYGRVSRMEAINAKAVLENSLRLAKSKLRKLQSALEKLELPEFGLCMTCGNKINEQRLLFMPESSHCVRCSR